MKRTLALTAITVAMIGSLIASTPPNKPDEEPGTGGGGQALCAPVSCLEEEVFPQGQDRYNVVNNCSTTYSFAFCISPGGGNVESCSNQNITPVPLSPGNRSAVYERPSGDSLVTCACEEPTTLVLDSSRPWEGDGTCQP